MFFFCSRETKIKINSTFVCPTAQFYLRTAQKLVIPRCCLFRFFIVFYINIFCFLSTFHLLTNFPHTLILLFLSFPSFRNTFWDFLLYSLCCVIALVYLLFNLFCLNSKKKYITLRNACTTTVALIMPANYKPHVEILM